MKAMNGDENAATLIVEGDIQPFCKTKSGCKLNEMHLHELALPTKSISNLDIPIRNPTDLCQVDYLNLRMPRQ